MKAADVDESVTAIGLHPTTVCAAIKHLLPVLHDLTRGRPWWLRLGMGVLIRALAEYRKATCP